MRSTSESIRIFFGQGSPLTEITHWITSDIELGGSAIFVNGTEDGDTNVVWDPIGLTEHPDVPLEGIYFDDDNGPADIFGTQSGPETPDYTLKVWWNNRSYTEWPCAIKSPCKPMGKVKDITRFRTVLTSRGPAEFVRQPVLTGWLADPDLAGAILLTEGSGTPAEMLTAASGAMSGATPPAWSTPEPTDLQPTLLFTNGGSLNSYAGFGSLAAFLNLGVNTPMTLIARIKWTGGQGGIAERCGASTTGWAWGVGSSNRLVFIKRQSLDRQCREAATSLTSGQWCTVAVTYAGEAAGVNGGSIANYLDGALLAGSNVRSGVGVNASDAAEAFRLGNSTIDFPGVGNPTMAGSFGGQIAWLLGFHRVLSAGELSSFTFLRT